MCAVVRHYCLMRNEGVRLDVYQEMATISRLLKMIGLFCKRAL